MWINLRPAIADLIQKIFDDRLTYNNIEPLFSHCKVMAPCDHSCPIYRFRWLADTFGKSPFDFWLMARGTFNKETQRWEQPK